MDVVHYRASNIAKEKEDRISNLPNEIIHHILSFLDTKYTIQASTFSRKWKQIWTSMPYLNINSQIFHTQPQSSKFVKHVLSQRNQRTKVCAVDLTFTGAPNQFVIRSILNYAYSHNVRQLTVIWLTKKVLEFPQSLFRSQTLKHLTLASNEHYVIGRSIPTYAWDFPSLETLNLSYMKLGGNRDGSLNLFSKCAKVFNAVASQLDNFTATLEAYDYLRFTYYFPFNRGLGFSKTSESLHVKIYLQKLHKKDRHTLPTGSVQETQQRQSSYT